MPKKNLAKYKLAAKEIRNHFNSSKYRSDRPEKAFIKWYILARFGLESGYSILEGKSDGGLDAIVQIDGINYVLQSKYELIPKVSLILRKEISDFEIIAERFASESDVEFNKWLIKVRGPLKQQYQRLRRAALQNPSKVKFILITSKRFNLEESERATVEDIQNIASLWYLYREGFTPPTDSIELRLEAAPPKEEAGFTTYVGLADVQDFLKLMVEDKNERLFAQNVRTDLRSQINKEIRRTYEQEPDKFWLGNNGIYIVCKDDKISGSTFKLIYPSIINGSQTLHSIFSSNKRHPCKILVRILKMDLLSNQSLLSSVIRRTNTQNPMKLINLSAHDPFQLNIARYLDRYQIFYERREKEWVNEKRSLLTNYFPLNIKDLGQALSTLHPDIGFGRARSRVSELFQAKFYKEIFNDFDPSFKSAVYKKLSLMVWSQFFVGNTVRNLNKDLRKFGKISQLLLYKMTFDALYESKLLEPLIMSHITNHYFGQNYLPPSIKQVYSQFVNSFKKHQKKYQQIEPNIDFSNFFKRDDLTKKLFIKTFPNSVLRKLIKAFEVNIGKIR